MTVQPESQTSPPPSSSRLWRTERRLVPSKATAPRQPRAAQFGALEGAGTAAAAKDRAPGAAAAGRSAGTSAQYGTLQAALWFAQDGMKVFPCNPRTKAPLLRADREGGWKEQASCDPARILGWWRRFPDAMIGLPTGHNLNAIVIDLDPGVNIETGETVTLADLYAQIEAAIGGSLPETWTVNTPSGGQHLYFAMPRDFLMPGNARGALPRHVDLRGEGGYVIAAGSVRHDGAAYSWDVPPYRVEFATAPAALIACLED